jgi:hypothetical protein
MSVSASKSGKVDLSASMRSMAKQHFDFMPEELGLVFT